MDFFIFKMRHWNLKVCMTLFIERFLFTPLTKMPLQKLLLPLLGSLLHLKMNNGMCKWDDHPSLWALQRFYVTAPNSDRRVEWLIPAKKVAKLEVIWDDENIQSLHANTDNSCTSHTCSNKGLVRIVFLLPLGVWTLCWTVPSGPFDRGMMPFHVAEMSWLKTAFKNSCSGLSYSQGDVMWWDVLPFDCALKKLTEVHSITLTQQKPSEKAILNVSRVISRENIWKFCSCFLGQTCFHVELQNVKTWQYPIYHPINYRADKCNALKHLHQIQGKLISHCKSNWLNIFRFWPVGLNNLVQFADLYSSF